jgi:hypothetical protein
MLGGVMKAKKALKRLGKIEALILKVTEQSSPDIRELLRDAKAAVIRAKEAVQASFETLKNLPPRYPSKATPEASKPKLPAAGRKAVSGATKKRLAAKKAPVAKPKPVAAEKGAHKKAAPVTVAKPPAREVAKKSPDKKAAPLKAKASARTVAKKAPAKKAALKTPAKKAVKMVRAAKTSIPPTLEVTAAETPEEVMQEAVVQEVEATAVETPEQAVPESPGDAEAPR